MGEIALCDRSLRVEVMQDRELGPAQPAVAKASPQAPGGGAGQAEDQEPEAGAQGRVARLGFGLEWCLDGAHGQVMEITYIP